MLCDLHSSLWLPLSVIQSPSKRKLSRLLFIFRVPSVPHIIKPDDFPYEIWRTSTSMLSSLGWGTLLTSLMMTCLLWHVYSGMLCMLFCVHSLLLQFYWVHPAALLCWLTLACMWVAACTAAMLHVWKQFFRILWYGIACSLSCENGGTINGDTCTHYLCSDEYSCRTNCTIDIDNCASNPCVNGTCTDLVNACRDVTVKLGWLEQTVRDLGCSPGLIPVPRYISTRRLFHFNRQLQCAHIKSEWLINRVTT